MATRTDQTEGEAPRSCRGRCPTIYVPLATDELAPALVIDLVPTGCLGACLVLEVWNV